MIIKTKIEFTLDTKYLDEDLAGLSTKDLINREISAFIDDVERSVKYNELQDLIKVEIEGEDN
jgi:hypothetical protein